MVARPCIALHCYDVKHVAISKGIKSNWDTKSSNTNNGLAFLNNGKSFFVADGSNGCLQGVTYGIKGSSRSIPLFAFPLQTAILHPYTNFNSVLAARFVDF